MYDEPPPRPFHTFKFPHIAVEVETTPQVADKISLKITWMIAELNPFFCSSAVCCPEKWRSAKPALHQVQNTDDAEQDRSYAGSNKVEDKKYKYMNTFLRFLPAWCLKIRLKRGSRCSREWRLPTQAVSLLVKLHSGQRLKIYFQKPTTKPFPDSLPRPRSQSMSPTNNKWSMGPFSRFNRIDVMNWQQKY